MMSEKDIMIAFMGTIEWITLQNLIFNIVYVHILLLRFFFLFKRLTREDSKKREMCKKA